MLYLILAIINHFIQNEKWLRRQAVHIAPHRAAGVSRSGALPTWGQLPADRLPWRGGAGAVLPVHVRALACFQRRLAATRSDYVCIAMLFTFVRCLSYARRGACFACSYVRRVGMPPAPACRHAACLCIYSHAIHICTLPVRRPARSLPCLCICPAPWHASRADAVPRGSTLPAHGPGAGQAAQFTVRACRARAAAIRRSTS